MEDFISHVRSKPPVNWSANRLNESLKYMSLIPGGYTAYGQWNVRNQKAFCFVGAEVPLYFMYVCKLHRCLVSQKKEYTGCTELIAVLYSYSIFLIQYIF